MKKFIQQIIIKARKHQKLIVLPEPEDERVLKAAHIILEEGIAKLVLLGNIKRIKQKAKRLRMSISKAQLIQPELSPHYTRYWKRFYRLRKHRGITLEEARQRLKEPIYYGTMMVYLNDAQGLVSGAAHTTAHTIRPALEIIKTKKRFHKVSGVFFMVMKKRLLFFADAAVTIEPDAKDLAEIAIDTARTAREFGVKPRIAMLSFSTHGSASHPLVDRIVEATRIIRYKRPDLPVEGEMQVDAALDREVCKRKFPGSRIKGNANVLIFPDLQSANISYKLVERLGRAKALGPILQGLKKPVNDLSRGASVSDIVGMVAVTSAQK